MIPDISIKITKDTATPALAELAASLTPARLAARVGPAVQNLVEEWLASLGPNKQGYPSTGFYEKFARNVRWTPQENGVIVGILPVVIHGRTVSLRQRLKGGPIAPVIAKALSIPMCAEAYGHVPSDFPEAFLIHTPKGMYLVQYESGKRKAESGKQRAPLKFLFVLKLSVLQEGDRNVLPPDQLIMDTALKAIAGGEN